MPPTMAIHPNINVDQLKSYVETEETKPPPGPSGETAQGEPVYDIERLLDKKRRRNLTFYKVRLKGLMGLRTTAGSRTARSRSSRCSSSSWRTRLQSSPHCDVLHDAVTEEREIVIYVY